MGFLGFSFGKKKRSTKHRSGKKHAKKHAKKPASKLLRICKKYRVKATKKVGGKRVYKSTATLKKLCLRKARALRKKLIKAHKKSMKHHKKAHKKRISKTHRRRRDAFGDADEEEMSFGRRRLPMFGAVSAFGKRRATKKVTKKAAMKAFRSFYKRHCAGRRSGFGNGGNPPLNASMGYEFCPNGMGGVLGFNSTGLFPSPCISQGSSAPVSMGSLPPATKVSEGAFGRRRRSTRRRVSSIGSRRRRSSAIGSRRSHHKRRTVKRRSTKKRCMASGSKRRCPAIGASRRRSTRRSVRR